MKNVERTVDAAMWGVVDKGIRILERVGFPIFITLYLLFGFGSKMDDVSKKLDRVIVLLERSK